MASNVTVLGSNGTIYSLGTSTSQVLAQVLYQLYNAPNNFNAGTIASGGTTQITGTTSAGTLSVAVAQTGGTISVSGVDDLILQGTSATDLSGNNVNVVGTEPVDLTITLTGSTESTFNGGTVTAILHSGTAEYELNITGTAIAVVDATGGGDVADSYTTTGTFVFDDQHATGTRFDLSGSNDVVSLSGDRVSVIGHAGGGNNASVNGGTVNHGYVIFQGQNDSVFAGTGADSIIMAGTSGVALGGSGTLGVQDSGLNDTIAAFGAESPTIQAWGKGALVFGGSNNAQVTLSGSGAQGGNTYIGGGGTSDVYMGAIVLQGVTNYSQGNAVVGGSGGALNITDDGQSDTIGAYGASSVTVKAGGSGLALIGGTGSLTGSIGGSKNTVYTGTGQTNLSIGGSQNVVFGGGPENITFTGSGSDTLLAGGSAPTNVTTSGSDLVLGGLDGSAGRLSVVSEGADTIVGFDASVANVSLAGGSGAQVVGGANAMNVNASDGLDANIYGGSGALSVTIAGVGLTTGDAVLGGSGSFTANDQGRGDTLAAFGASSANVSVGGSHNLVFGGAHTFNGSIAGSSNTVFGGSGTSNLSIGGAGSKDVFLGGSGAINLVDSGTSDTIAAFAAPSATVSLQGSSGVFLGGSGTANVTDAGSGDTLYGGTNTLTVTQDSGSSGLVVWGGSGPLSFTGATNGATIIGSTGTTTITQGSVTLFGAPGGVVNYNGGVGGIDFLAGSGNETLNASGSSTGNLIHAGSAADSLVGGSGSDTFVAAAGSATMTGGANSNLFVFFDGSTGGHDYITDWTSQDSVYLLNYGSTAAQVFQTASVSSGNLTLTLSDNTQITFENVGSVSALNGHVLST